MIMLSKPNHREVEAQGGSGSSTSEWEVPQKIPEDLV